MSHVPDSKVHWANMRPTWVLSAPHGPHVGPMNLAIWGFLLYIILSVSVWFSTKPDLSYYFHQVHASHITWCISFVGFSPWLLQLHLHSLLQPGFNGLGKDNCKMRWQTCDYWDLVQLIPVIKVRQPHNCLIFIIEISIPGKLVFYEYVSVLSASTQCWEVMQNANILDVLPKYIPHYQG